MCNCVSRADARSRISNHLCHLLCIRRRRGKCVTGATHSSRRAVGGVRQRAGGKLRHRRSVMTPRNRVTVCTRNVGVQTTRYTAARPGGTMIGGRSYAAAKRKLLCNRDSASTSCGVMRAGGVKGMKNENELDRRRSRGMRCCYVIARPSPNESRTLHVDSPASPLQNRRVTNSPTALLRDMRAAKS